MSHYTLREEADGCTYIYVDGVRHSRKGVRTTSDAEREVLEAVPALLNKEQVPERLMLAAYSMYLHRLW